MEKELFASSKVDIDELRDVLAIFCVVDAVAKVAEDSFDDGKDWSCLIFKVQLGFGQKFVGV